MKRWDDPDAIILPMLVVIPVTLVIYPVLIAAGILNAIVAMLLPRR